MSDHTTVWSLYLIPFYISLGPEKTISGLCSHMASYLHDKAVTCICGWHNERCLHTKTSGSVTESLQKHAYCVSCFPKDQRLPILMFGLVSHTQRFLQILWIFWGYHPLFEILKMFTIWYLEALFWNCSTTGRCSFLQTDESLSSFPSERRCVFLLLTCCHLTQLVAKCSSSCFMLVPLTLPGFSCPQVFFRHVDTST